MSRGAVSCERGSVECKESPHENPAKAVVYMYYSTSLQKAVAGGIHRRKICRDFQESHLGGGRACTAGARLADHCGNSLETLITQFHFTSQGTCDIRSRGKSISHIIICSLRASTPDPEIVPQIRQRLRQLEGPSLHASIPQVLSPPTQRRTPHTRKTRGPTPADKESQQKAVAKM